MRGRADYSPNADVKEVTTQTRHPGEKALAGLSLAALAEADVALHPVSHSSSKMLWETPYETGYTQSSPSSAIPPQLLAGKTVLYDLFRWLLTEKQSH